MVQVAAGGESRDVGEDFELTGLELVEEAPLNGGEVRCLRLAREAETVLGEVCFNRAGIFGARFARDEFACLEQVGVERDVEEINRDVVRRMDRLYRARLPLLPGALKAVQALHDRWPLGLASSSNREIIDLVLEEAAPPRIIGEP